MVTRRFARRGRLNPAGSLKRRRRTGIPGRAMGNIIDPNPPILGDGWTQEGPNTFVYNTSVAVTPVLEFTGAVVGLPYRVVVNCSELTGSAPLVVVEMGAQLFFNIDAPGLYDAAFKALGTSLTFTVNTNATTTKAILKAIYVVAQGGIVGGSAIDYDALVVYLTGQGWQAVKVDGGLLYEGQLCTDAYLKGCDFSDLSAPMANDLKAGLNVQGFCL